MEVKRPARRKRLVSLLQNLLFAQHVSGTIMPVIGSSRVIQMVAACGTWRFGLQVVGLVWSCGLCVRLVWCGIVGYVSGFRDVIRSSRVIQMVAACGNLRLGLQVVGLMSCGLCVRLVWCGIVGYMSGLRDV